MALATQCPHCSKRFRVAADQLKLRGGIVRCGACHEIFDGNATLIDLDALAAQHAAHSDTTQPTPEPEIAAAPPSVPAGQTESQSDASAFAPKDSDLDADPIYTLDFDHTFDSFGILPKPAATHDQEPQPDAHEESASVDEVAPEPAAESETLPEPEAEPASEPLAHDTQPEPAPVQEEAPAPSPEPEPEAGAPDQTPRTEPTLGLPVDEELVAAPLPDYGHEEPALQETAPPPRPALHTPSAGTPLPMRESAPVDAPAQARTPLRPKSAEARAARRSKLTPTKIAPPKLRVPDIDEPEFVKRSRQQEQSGKTRRILMAVGSVVLLLALAAQGVASFRNVLAARFPAAKPALAATCAVLGCRVELPARIDNLTIEQGELTALGTNAYSLTTLLHNQGSLVQAWPHIELTLTDANDKPLLRRVFTPVEFLPQAVTPATGFAARAEQPIKLYFQLDQLKPSGYRIAVFYP